MDVGAFYKRLRRELVFPFLVGRARKISGPHSAPLLKRAIDDFQAELILLVFTPTLRPMSWSLFRIPPIFLGL